MLRHKCTSIAKALGALSCLALLLLVSRQQTQALQEKAEKDTCHANLLAISDAVMQYRKDHGGKLPRTLLPNPLVAADDALYPRYIKSRQVFVCPGRVNFQISQFPDARAKILASPDAFQYDYLVSAWMFDYAGSHFKTSEFYNQIVPQKADKIRLIQCGFHSRDLNGEAIMMDGSIQQQPLLYDALFGRGQRDPNVRQRREEIRRQGGKFADDAA